MVTKSSYLPMAEHIIVLGRKLSVHICAHILLGGPPNISADPLNPLLERVEELVALRVAHAGFQFKGHMFSGEIVLMQRGSYIGLLYFSTLSNPPPLTVRRVARRACD
jgi:hypothetical protein